MITIAHSDLRITRRPTIAAVGTNAAGTAATFQVRDGIEAIGTVTFHGAPSDAGAGWAVGFLQAQWVETNWGYYRGRQSSEGSLLVQRARPPARTQQACFDCVLIGAPFYGTGAAPATAIPITGGPALPFVAALPNVPAFPLTIRVIHRDFPGDAFSYRRRNGRTRQANFLAECELEFAFCISLVVQDPRGVRQFLQSVYWNVNWQDEFVFAPGAVVPRARQTRRGNGANVGPIIAGRPADPRFIGVLTTPQMTNCNAIAAAEEAHPDVRESASWSNFDVAR